MGKITIAKVAPALLLTLIIFAAVPGVADAISDILTLYNPAGMAVQTLSVMESQEGNGNQAFFIGVNGLADPAQYGHATTLCASAPCDANSSRSNFSDIFGVVQVVNRKTHALLSCLRVRWRKRDPNWNRICIRRLGRQLHG